jgi:hypothetical protein
LPNIDDGVTGNKGTTAVRWTTSALVAVLQACIHELSAYGINIQVLA